MPAYTLETVCLSCGSMFQVELGVQGSPESSEGETLTMLPDVGHVSCDHCGASWCLCQIHGIYECPPPCSKCHS